MKAIHYSKTPFWVLISILAALFRCVPCPMPGHPDSEAFSKHASVSFTSPTCIPTSAPSSRSLKKNSSLKAFAPKPPPHRSAARSSGAPIAVPVNACVSWACSGWTPSATRVPPRKKVRHRSSCGSSGHASGARRRRLKHRNGSTGRCGSEGSCG